MNGTIEPTVVKIISSCSNAQNFCAEVREEIKQGNDIRVVCEDMPDSSWLKAAKEIADGGNKQISFETGQGQKFTVTARGNFLFTKQI